jgi:hypothetical protein
MKRLISMVAVCALFLGAGSLAAADKNPFVGTWKLNVAASKFDPGPPPKSQNRVWRASGSVIITGVTQAGKAMAYSYILRGDDRKYPTSGAIPNGADLVSSKKVDSNTLMATFTKGGKQVESTKFTVSKDGKTLVIMVDGILPTGQKMNNETHWDKQ